MDAGSPWKRGPTCSKGGEDLFNLGENAAGGGGVTEEPGSVAAGGGDVTEEPGDVTESSGSVVAGGGSITESRGGDVTGGDGNVAGVFGGSAALFPVPAAVKTPVLPLQGPEPGPRRPGAAGSGEDASVEWRAPAVLSSLVPETGVFSTL
jgi:hypothetical protein